MSKNSLKQLTFSAVMLALALLLPFLTVNNMELGNMLSPMHLPIMLCGLVCGWKYGFVVGATAPFLRMFIIGMPPMFKAVPMAFELAVYGLLCGILWGLFKKKFYGIYVSLIVAMIMGRVVHALVKFTLVKLAVFDKLHSFALSAYMTESVLQAWPGILLQLLLLPALVFALQKFGFIEKEATSLS